jgi:hypothetical protein
MSGCLILQDRHSKHLERSPLLDRFPMRVALRGKVGTAAKLDPVVDADLKTVLLDILR